MIAYNKDWMDHLGILTDVEQSFLENGISKNEYEKIKEKYPVGFYTPNIFMRMGLFLLTNIILLFSFGLLLLVCQDVVEHIYGGLLIAFSILCYLALEYIIRKKNHYNSGVDNALLWAASIALFCGLSLPNEPGDITNCMIAALICLFGSLRYADKLMAAVMFTAILGVLFYSAIDLGSVGKAIVPFIIMTASCIAYFIVRKMQTQEKFIIYSGCFQAIEILSLIFLYVAGNYFVVRELSNSMFHLNLLPADSIPLGWLFWMFTCILPLVYLVSGIIKKNAILIRVGVVLIAAIIFTFRYYYAILDMEIAMTIAGAIILIIAYGLTKYLNEPKFGFTYKAIKSHEQFGNLQLESMIIAQTFKPGTDAAGTKFGGGSFGGGGASGEF